MVMYLSFDQMLSGTGSVHLQLRVEGGTNAYRSEQPKPVSSRGRRGYEGGMIHAGARKVNSSYK